MPVEVGEDTLLVLASALAVETTWVEPFAAPYKDEPGTGAWAGRPVALRCRITGDPSAVRGSASLTMVRVDGDNGIDVHLALGTPAAGGRGADGRAGSGSTRRRSPSGPGTT